MVMRNPIRAAFVILALQLGSAGSPAWAAPESERAMQFVRKGLGEVFAVLRERNLTNEQKTGKLRALMRRDFDMAAVGRFALGAYGRTASRKQLTAYLEAFEDHVVETYAGRLVHFVGPTLARIAENIIEVTGTRPAGKRDVFVRTDILRVGDSPLAVDWRVREHDGRLKIIDVYFLGISQALTYKQEFTSVIGRRDGGIDGLIVALREKAFDRKDWYLRR